MLSELFTAARRLRDPIGKTPLLIKAFSPFVDVTVAGSKEGVEDAVSVSGSFDREELVNSRIDLAE
jgi:hypothetical protein